MQIWFHTVVFPESKSAFKLMRNSQNLIKLLFKNTVYKTEKGIID